MCQHFKLAAGDCRSESFDKPIAIDIDADNYMEWIYVNTKGGDKDCFVRHACFAVLNNPGNGSRWEVVFGGKGSELAVSGFDKGKVEQDLIVAASNSAAKSSVTLYSWQDGRYHPGKSVTCRTGVYNSAEPICAALEHAKVIQ